MTASRFTHLLRSILDAEPFHLPASDVDPLTPHSLRHVLPTWAHQAQLPGGARLTLGLWTGHEDLERQRELRRAAMSLLYAADKAGASALVKLQLWRSFRTAVLHFAVERYGAKG